MKSEEGSRYSRIPYSRPRQRADSQWSLLDEEGERSVTEGHRRCSDLSTGTSPSLVKLGKVPGLSVIPARAEKEFIEGLFRDFLGEVLSRVGEAKEGCEETPRYVRSIPIHDLGSEALELVGPLQVEVECYDEEIISKIPELGVWASAPTEGEAIMAIKNRVIDLFEELSGLDDAVLGKLPRMWKRILSKRITRTAVKV